MNARILRNVFLWTMALLFAASGAARADGTGVFIGTWQLNAAKSRLQAGAERDSTVIYKTLGDSVTCTIDGHGGDGQPIHNSWTGKFDGKFYPVIGDPSVDMRSYRLIRSHILSATEMKSGKVVGRARVMVSEDGKTRTVTVHNTGANGATITTIAVYNRE